MPAKSEESRRKIAGCINVDLPLTITFNEMLSLRWALERLRELTTSGVVPVPKDREGCLRPTIDKALHCISVVGPEAEKRVDEEARKEGWK